MSEEELPTTKRQGIPRLLWGMIVRPRRTLRTLNEHGGRRWWLPALLAVLFAILPVVAAAPITARRSREAVAAVQEQMGGEERSAEEQAQMEQAMSIAASPLITTVFPAVGGVMGLVLGWLMRSGGLYLAGMALGGRSTFRQMFRTVVWTWLPYTLRGALQTVYILASGQLIANPGLSGFVLDERAAESIVLAQPSVGKILLASFLGRVDLFLVWHLILLTIGVMVTTRLSRRKTVLVTLGVWLLLTALSLLPALVGGLFTRQAGIS